MGPAAQTEPEMSAAKKLRIFRSLHGLSQKEFAHYLDADGPAAAKWEKGVYLPKPDAMMAAGIYSWIKRGDLLPPQLFLPSLPDSTVRSQSVNYLLASIGELLPDFCRNENISPSDIEIVSFSDGDLIRLSGHIVIALGSFKQIEWLLPAGYQPGTKAHGEGLLSTAIKEKKSVNNLLQKYFGIDSKRSLSLNTFRIEADLWERSITLPFTVSLKGVDPSLQQEVANEIRAVVTEALTAKYKPAAGAKFAVSVEL